MIDRCHVGHRFAPFSTVIEAGRVRLFCKAIGETDPIYFDEAAAHAAGLPEIPTPITFPTAIAMDSPNPRAIIELVGVDISWILHGEEKYEYLAPIHVGDHITTEIVIEDIYDKKGGVLEFIVICFNMTNADGACVCKIRRSLVSRRPSGTGAAEGTSR